VGGVLEGEDRERADGARAGEAHHVHQAVSGGEGAEALRGEGHADGGWDERLGGGHHAGCQRVARAGDGLRDAGDLGGLPVAPGLGGAEGVDGVDVGLDEEHP
jgi:hypothetical protein